MPETTELRLSQFQYDLPDERIARFPLPQRDASKLLVYQSGRIVHARFTDLPGFLPDRSFLVFNNTKVIPARLHFTKPTGAVIELFLLNPVSGEASPSGEPVASQPISLAMEATGSVIWQGMIGNRKRWKPTESLSLTLSTPKGTVMLRASWHDIEQSTVQLTWTPADLTFAEVIRYAGEIPLPPYLKRATTETDRETYQTVYSKQEGAVASPTAGLHFTPAVFDKLKEKAINSDYLTLHVGAGTFQPIKAEDVREHHMHTEQVIYTRQNLNNLLLNLDTLIAVGTTSMRALESLYWMGVKLLRNELNPFQLDQHFAYQIPTDQQPPAETAIRAVLQYLISTNQESVVAHTGIYITPGYVVKLCKGIITNFHQPGSTLILLIAALIGDDWRTIYKEALANDYRFLSYGDSSLLLP
ncbi:S-adenosylmethionine:tRNA ribosyltransferase-isomerase [Spirosoma utsteinense]|uniref:S-adenosylmethionine:tRNA ribosyltransferase-isomerase n=1 Tax=Spirosoma utsteinense TaxID=2585773 RepID=A0ABR6W314_9BACT|nr:S-adenosylmethionine:tRNA ribosyltransferase-isomerase [Spirosoma utsteinense]MBC3790974.1 S-adenosylmethionine:tRNA ribosyltransferase-isomerase [Spirosoma utsteinense]